jgi:energy-coupling factor transporter transmembrane protein EcfT
MSFNALAWCLWALAALSAAFLGRNPFLQGLLALVLFNVWLLARHQSLAGLRIGVGLAILPIVFSAAFSRFGRHVIFTLPNLPLVGGYWTWEAVVFGAVSGAALALTVAVFSIVQSTVRSADLLSLLPPPLYRTGTVLALSLAFTTKVGSAYQSIREARRLRDQRTGWQSAPAVLLPLLLTTLEQALQFGESLDARGFGHVRRSRYRPLRWFATDSVLTAGAIAAFLLLLLSPASIYNPYIALPPALPSAGSVVAVLLLALPAASPLLWRIGLAPDQA